MQKHFFLHSKAHEQILFLKFAKPKAISKKSPSLEIKASPNFNPAAPVQLHGRTHPEKVVLYSSDTVSET